MNSYASQNILNINKKWLSKKKYLNLVHCEDIIQDWSQKNYNWENRKKFITDNNVRVKINTKNYKRNTNQY